MNKYIIIINNKISEIAFMPDDFSSETVKIIDYEPYKNLNLKDMFWDGNKIVITNTTRLLSEQSQLKQLLIDTDWYIVRLAETQVPVPQEVLDQRARARLRISEIRDEIARIQGEIAQLQGEQE